MLRYLSIALLLAASLAHADDRAACGAGDKRACARIGHLEQLGALKPDGSADLEKLSAVCGAALDGAKDSGSMRDVASACGPIFNPELQKGWEVMGNVVMSHLDGLLATAYGEAYCPLLAAPIAGCKGKRSANFSPPMKSAEIRGALKALNAKALEKELGAAKAAPLIAKFDSAWSRFLGPEG